MLLRRIYMAHTTQCSRFAATYQPRDRENKINTNIKFCGDRERNYKICSCPTNLRSDVSYVQHANYTSKRTPRTLSL